MSFLSNPIIQIIIGAAVSFLGSVWANYLFMNKRAKDIEVQRAYNRLVDYIVRLDVLPDPNGFLPLPIAERCDDLRFALRLKSEKFDTTALINKAIEQAAEVRKEIERKKGSENQR